MKMKNNFNKFLSRLRVKRGYRYSSRPTTNYDKNLKKVFISIIIVIIIILLKMIDTGFTNKSIRIIKNTVNYDLNIKEDSKKVLEYAKKILNYPKKVVTAFNSEDNIIKSEEDEYVSPVKGVVYKAFGNEKKADNVTIFNKGIEILTSEKTVLATGNGIVEEIGEDNLKGKYIKINHGKTESIYGYLGDIYVNKGSKVEAGQTLGELSKTHNNMYIFYFELWENNAPIDPLTKISISSNNSVLR